MALIIAAALVGLLAFVGFAIDLGRYLVVMGRLRQAVDAGALAASAQFRENRNVAEMRRAAGSIIHANGFNPTSLVVDTCATDPGDAYLCNPPRRKKVRVKVEVEMPTVFLQIIGINKVPLKAEAVGEAAAMDVVLVLDTSESMTYDAPPGTAMRDPSKCNPVHGCHPFEEVRSSALNFVSRVLNIASSEEQDRVAVVTFSDGWRAGDTAPKFPPGTPTSAPLSAAWTYDYGVAASIINGLQVFDPGWTCPSDLTSSDAPGPCRRYDGGGAYLGLDCPLLRNPAYNDPSTCTTTNIGGGLFWASQLLSTSGREDALWIVILLTDGAANATLPSSTDDLSSAATLRASLPIGYCPSSTFGSPPFCRDTDPDTRHAASSSAYDADDYAHDMADLVACSASSPAPGCAVGGQSAIIFAIGLGNASANPDGGALLRYIAAVGDDGDPATDPCQGITDYNEWCGNYYHSPTGSELDQVFADIASRLFTRLTH